MTMTWANGRRLTSITASGLSASYTYNEAGIRTGKTVGGVTTTYVLAGTSILKQTRGADTLVFYYDTKGEAFGFTYNGTEYWYVRNGQRDIVGIINNAGTVVVSYTYDAWGNPIATTGTLAATVGAANPFRYRGYYYDSETGFYYLNSRYYDPVIGRFISSDSIVDTGQGVLGTNMFAYCLNNPVNRADPNGCLSSDTNEYYVPKSITFEMLYPDEGKPSNQPGIAGLDFLERLEKEYPEVYQRFIMSQLTHSYLMSLFSNVGRNGVEYYWWGYRVYIDGPTCNLLTPKELGYGLAASDFICLFLAPEVTPVISVICFAYAEIDYYNKGKGVYYDVWSIPIIPGSPYFTMRSQ